MSHHHHHRGGSEPGPPLVHFPKNVWGRCCPSSSICCHCLEHSHSLPRPTSYSFPPPDIQPGYRRLLPQQQEAFIQCRGFKCPSTAKHTFHSQWPSALPLAKSPIPALPFPPGLSVCEQWLLALYSAAQRSAAPTRQVRTQQGRGRASRLTHSRCRIEMSRSQSSPTLRTRASSSGSKILLHSAQYFPLVSQNASQNPGECHRPHFQLLTHNFLATALGEERVILARHRLVP